MTRIAKLAILFGLAAVLAFVGLLLFDAPLEYGLDCNRFSGRCVFAQRFLTRSKVGSAPIGSLERAEVRVVPGRRGAPRIMVWAKSRSAGGDSFFADYSSKQEAQEAAGKIDAFLRDPSDGRLVMAHKVRGMYWLAWALVPIVAALAVAIATVLFSSKRVSVRKGE